MKPPLGLAVEVTDADGNRTRWDADSTPDRRPQGITFRTSRSTGFADSACTLPRRIDREAFDVALLDDFKLIGDDGTVAYEGRVTALPRSMSDTHSLTVQAAGWMAAAADRKFCELFIDRDLGQWGAPAREEHARLLAADYTDVGSGQVQQDGTAMAVLTEISGAWAAPYKPITEGWYDAGPECRIARLRYGWKRTPTVDPADTNWWWEAAVSDDSQLAVGDFSGNLRAVGPGSGLTLNATALSRRFAAVHLRYTASPAGTDGASFGIYWEDLAVIGTHTAPVSADGVTASDVIRDLARRYAPALNTAGVESTTYPIPHLVFRDRTTPYDAFLAVNAYHLWDLAVWEDRTLTYSPVDLSDYDWQVRLDQPGVRVDLQGDSTDGLANGIVVQYTDVTTGRTATLTPQTNPELADPDPENPATRHGLQLWQEIGLSYPTTADAAVQLGRAALADFTTPKAPGTITVQGHVMDRAGHWLQPWRVRAGDTVAITNHQNDRPRLITETSYDHASRTVSLTVEGQPRRLDAVLARIAAGVSGKNLG